MANSILNGLLEGDVRHKHNNTKNFKKIKNITNRVPEVMVKISGNAKGEKHLKSHLEYISRNGNLELENERGEIIKGSEELKELKAEWVTDIKNSSRKKNTRDTTNIVLSMPKGTDSEKLKDAVRSFAHKRFASNYQYVFALHDKDSDDVEHPHVHLTIKNLGFNGKRLHIKKGDPQKYREEFAKELNNRGIEAEATPRSARGVIKKSVNQVIKHIRDRGIVPKVDKEKVKQILDEVREGRASIHPLDEKAIQKQKGIRSEWLSLAKQLVSNTDQEDSKYLAKNIVSFVNTMPPITTERQELRASVLARIKSVKDKELER